MARTDDLHTLPDDLPIPEDVREYFFNDWLKKQAAGGTKHTWATLPDWKGIWTSLGGTGAGSSVESFTAVVLCALAIAGSARIPAATISILSFILPPSSERCLSGQGEECKPQAVKARN